MLSYTTIKKQQREKFNLGLPDCRKGRSNLKKTSTLVWKFMPVIPALGRKRRRITLSDLSTVYLVNVLG